MAWAAQEAALGVGGVAGVAVIVRGQHTDGVLRASAAAVAADGVYGSADCDLDAHANADIYTDVYTDANFNAYARSHSNAHN